MGFYQFKKEIRINASLQEVWDFVSNPANLKEITPEYMGFEITSYNLRKRMYPGMIISYVVKPFAGLKTIWVTEITQVKDQQYFVDEQRIGPFKMWHHEHFIETTEEGVLMTDIVSYQTPFGYIGSLVNKLFIKSRLNEIFDHRQRAIEKKYP